MTSATDVALRPLDAETSVHLDAIMVDLQVGEMRCFGALQLGLATLVATRSDRFTYTLQRRRATGDRHAFKLTFGHLDRGNGPRWYPLAADHAGEMRIAVALTTEGQPLLEDRLWYSVIRTSTGVILAELRRGYDLQRRRVVAIDDRGRVSALAQRFPSLAAAPGIDPWEPLLLEEWVCTSSAMTDSTRHAARFMLALWNAEHDDRLVFDVVEALGVWGHDDRAAFLVWSMNPWYPARVPSRTPVVSSRDHAAQ